jgi:hypothetical protein
VNNELFKNRAGLVQNRYAGDVGDYVKFGLLRALTGADDEPALSLGVMWYLTADEDHNQDGKHALASGSRARGRTLDAARSAASRGVASLDSVRQIAAPVTSASEHHRSEASRRLCRGVGRGRSEKSAPPPFQADLQRPCCKALNRRSSPGGHVVHE